MNFAVVGVGNFGIKRASAIKNSKNANLAIEITRFSWDRIR